MESDSDKIKDSVRQLTIIYMALIAGQIFFFAATFFLLQQKEGFLHGQHDLKNVFNYIAPLLTIFSIPMGYFMYNQQCKQGISLSTTDEKLQRYRTASIIKYALFEGANFMNIIALLLTNGQTFVFLFLIIIVVFLINKPSESRFNADLGIEQSGNS